jgi:2,4-dienoyl-CoA reductase-like NADH-dependent reductase (Old Yellow Enzyme family)
MWKPPEKIRHETRPGTWPTAGEAKSSRLFSPLRHGALDLRTRTWIPAMVPWRATGDGFVTQDNIDWYVRFAQGRPGAIVLEATGIRDVPSGPLLRIGHARFVPGLETLVQRVKEASRGETRVLAQLIDFLGIRRRPPADTFFKRFLRVTDRHRDALGAQDWPDADVRAALAALGADELAAVLTLRELEDLTTGYRERVTDTHLPHIADLPAVLPGLFATAAARARDAGFDGVELHYAHAYTMASFLSRTNSRTDGYGGTLENRLRLPLEVLAAVRKATGTDFAVGCRYLADECIDGGNTIADGAPIGASLARAGMTFLSLSRGGKFDDAKQPKVGEAAYPYTGRSGYECMPGYISDAAGPFGRNVAATSAVRAAVRAAGFDTPVVVAGGMHGFAQAETLLRDGAADIVGFARQALADPDWFRKVRGGHGSAVRLCEYTNYCEGLDQKHKQVTCQLWDRQDIAAPGVPLSSDGKRRLVAPAWDTE